MGGFFWPLGENEVARKVSGLDLQGRVFGEVADVGGGDVVGLEEVLKGGDVLAFDGEEVAEAGEAGEPFEPRGFGGDGEVVEGEGGSDLGAVGEHGEGSDNAAVGDVFGGA